MCETIRSNQARHTRGNGSSARRVKKAKEEVTEPATSKEALYHSLISYSEEYIFQKILILMAFLSLLNPIGQWQLMSARKVKKSQKRGQGTSDK